MAPCWRAPGSARACLARVFLATLVAGSMLGCAQGATTLPSGPPTRSTAPSVHSAPPSHAIDLGHLLENRLAEVSGSGDLTATGTMTSDDKTYPMTGTLRYSRSESDAEFTVNPAGPSEIAYSFGRSIVAGTSCYEMAPNGAWIINTTATAMMHPIAGAIAGAEGFEESGIVRRGGTTLHRLVPTSNSHIPASVFGLTDASVRDFETTMAFLVLPDATPKWLEFGASWNEGPEDAPVPNSLVLDFDLSGLGDEVAIDAPADVWKTFSSARNGYTIALPSDWEVSESGEADVFMAPNLDDAIAMISEETRLSPDEWGHQIFVGFTEEPGAEPEMADRIEVDGAPGWFFGQHVDGSDELYLVVAFVRGGRGYALVWSSPAGDEDADLETFQEIAGNFAFL